MTKINPHGKKNCLLFFFLLGFLGLCAQEAASGDSDLAEAAANAANPLAFVTKLQFQPNYTWKDGGGDQFSLIARILQPTATIGLPFIKSDDPSKVYTIYRLEAPVVSQTFPDNKETLDATGISDLILLDAVVFKQNWGLLGVGAGLIIPTASPDILGTGKWSAGPIFVALNTATPGLQWGALGQQFFSFAGDSDRGEQNFMLFQPIFNKILGKGLFLQLSPIMKFDWANGQYTVPISVVVGKAFARNLTMSIGPEYVVSGPNQGDFTLRLNFNGMLAPPGG